MMERGGRGWRRGSEDYACLKSLVIFQNSVRPRTEFQIDAVKLQLSIINQMCHLDILLLRKNTKDGKLCR